MVDNCVVWNGTTLPLAVISVSHSDVQGGAAGDGNLDIDPQFVDLQNGDLRLSNTSPLIDAASAGTPGELGSLQDLGGAPRHVGLAPDMGAFEFQILEYPGTSEDLELLTGSHAAPSGGAEGDVLFVEGGDPLQVDLLSPGGTFNGGPVYLWAAPFFTGLPPSGPFPGLHLGTGFIVQVVGHEVPPYQVVGLPAAGLALDYVLPAGLGGYSVMLQGAVLSPTAMNNFAAFTDAHELRFVD